ncbi:DNA-binding transcriptional LysR family regulator [Paraburkholderia sp. BL18I3N2]|uniref:LysR family transcriptional regulator n=1 Tax=unclassified Paraburkholderia TaxID=2615204 RepID=UPI000D07E36E|nr:MULTISPECIES: LysR family transcriptional regulator [unclassified Paraburkholderia]PRX19219.1 DNA-binding transcriptional LysR family regulator [Paraburkholderia sp. BL18I3N2]PRX89398.1 DNA-binding transcriptional LysR family regulator [Paraburkholderia sp. BL25I1N1]REE07536.1 DNA-binding transcriptional LysR family regulator [Paraburkholderia sp. BL27I4N3]
MRRKIPSTSALSAFESAARHQSFTKAADELAVTQSAVCRQIGVLEDFLGVKLFRRSRRGVALTEAGTAYSRKVGSLLDMVERDTLELMAKGGQGGTLELAVVPTFATKWLLPRMPLFVQEHPDVTVHLAAQTRPFLFGDTVFDAAIHAGTAGWPGTESVFLMGESLIAVCSPGLIAPRKTLDRADWSRYPLLQMSTRPYAWRDWFASRDMQVGGDMSGPRFELFSMLAEAAVHGMGVALIPRLLVEDELRRGVLVEASRYEHASDRSYYLIYPEQKSENVALTVFRVWIESQARQYWATARLD